MKGSLRVCGRTQLYCKPAERRRECDFLFRLSPLRVERCYSVGIIGPICSTVLHQILQCENCRVVALDNIHAYCLEQAVS